MKLPPIFLAALLGLATVSCAEKPAPREKIDLSGSATAVAALRDVVNWGIGFHESRVFTAERRDAGQLTTTHSETDPAR